MANEAIIKGFKGFDKDFKCKDLQYKVGETTEITDELTICDKGGLHFCLNPFDIFGFYPPSDSRFAEVEGIGKHLTHNEDSKIAVSKLTVKCELSLKSLIDFGVKVILEKVDFKNAHATNTGDSSAATNTGGSSAATNTGYSSAATNTGYSSAATNTGGSSAATNTGDSSAATNTGDSSAATNTGYSSAATNTGYRSAATNTGDRSAATNTGYSSAATNTGYRSAATNTGGSSAATNTGYSSAATNTGYRSAATNTGDRSAATNTGYRSAATNTGDRSAAIVEGAESVAMSIGIECKAKGALGCWLVLAEWTYTDKWHRTDVKSVKVDGKKIKADTFYMLVGGKFKIVE